MHRGFALIARKVAPDKWGVFSHGARKPTGLDAVEWAKRAVSLGAGEIVLNSIDADGTKAGFDLVITRRISESVGVPVVASGGAGSLEHMAAVLLEGKADAVLAASIFHFGTYTVGDVKKFFWRGKRFRCGLNLKCIHEPASMNTEFTNPSSSRKNRLNENFVLTGISTP